MQHRRLHQVLERPALRVALLSQCLDVPALHTAAASARQSRRDVPVIQYALRAVGTDTPSTRAVSLIPISSELLPVVDAAIGDSASA
jgi:hypothetical protein